MKYLNNPLNIRYSPANIWQGQIKPKKGFCQFKSLYYGIRAAVLLVHRYRSFGYKSVKEIISRWAPEYENNTKSYISFVCGQTNWSEDYEINDIDLYFLFTNMIRIEQGLYDVKLDSDVRAVFSLLYFNHEIDCLPHGVSDIESIFYLTCYGKNGY